MKRVRHLKRPAEGWSPPAREAWIETKHPQGRSWPAISSPPAREAWIETDTPRLTCARSPSRLPRGRRGLKRDVPALIEVQHASPPAREAWIETVIMRHKARTKFVASRAGGVDRNGYHAPQGAYKVRRLPRGRRGLKLVWTLALLDVACRLPRGRRGLKLRGCISLGNRAHVASRAGGVD